MDEAIAGAWDEAAGGGGAEASDDGQVTRLEEELTRVEAQRLATLARLRDAFLATEPALAPDLIAGETVEELEASFVAARETLAKVREQLRREAAVAVGAGSPERTTRMPATAIDKIRAGLGGRP